jgi:hypothetical protein
MQYTKLHCAGVRLAMLLSAGFVVVLPAADLAVTFAFELGGFGEQRTTTPFDLELSHRKHNLWSGL